MSNIIKVSYFNIPEDSIDNAILGWWVSRSEDTFEVLQTKLRKMSREEKMRELEPILKQDLPIREFIPIFIVIENAPRSYIDQLDRSRVGFAFWEQSLRVKDLSKNFDYYIPHQIESNKDMLKKYDAFMESSRLLYTELVDNGIPREMARGVIPLHIDARLSFTCNLRSLMGIVRSRTCYFAQAQYWEPVIDVITSELYKVLPFMRDEIRKSLPCSRGLCPFEKDLLDRLEDKSNPVCPLLFNFLEEKQSKDIIAEMIKRYGTGYIQNSIDYLNKVSDGKSKAMIILNKINTWR